MGTREEMILAQQIDDLDAQRAALIDELTAARIWRAIKRRTFWPRPWNMSRHDGEGHWFPCPTCGEPRVKKAIHCMACASELRKKQP